MLRISRLDRHRCPHAVIDVFQDPIEVHDKVPPTQEGRLIASHGDMVRVYVVIIHHLGRVSDVELGFVVSNGGSKGHGEVHVELILLPELKVRAILESGSPVVSSPPPRSYPDP